MKCRLTTDATGSQPTGLDWEKVYIAGPMRGFICYNFPAFDQMAERLRHERFAVVSPAELDRENGFDPFNLPIDTDWTKAPPGFDMRECIRRDVAEIADCDWYVMLDGWERSAGAKAEKAIADWMGLTRLDPGTLEPWESNLLREADRITSGDRQQEYGHPLDHWTITAGLWSNLFGRPFKPSDVGLAWICDKLARHMHGQKHDNLVDIAGYARCIEKVSQEQARQMKEGA